MLARLFAVLLLAPLLLPLTGAAPDPTAPGIDRWVESELELSQPTLVQIVLEGDLLLRKHALDGRTYAAGDLAQEYRRLLAADEAAAQAFLRSVEDAVRDGFASSLAASFPRASRSLSHVSADASSFLADRKDAFDPPIRISVGAVIDQNAEDVGLGDADEAGLAAVFASGGRVRTTLNLVASPGQSTTYTILPPARPAGVVFSQLTEGAVAPDGSSVTVRLDNARGTLPLGRAVVLHVLDPSVDAPVAESITSEVEIMLGDPQGPQRALPLEARVRSSIAALDVASRFPGALPPGVSFDVIGADGLRALRQAKVLKDSALASADKALLDALLGSLSGTSVATGGLDRADLARPVARPYDLDPPVLFAGTATGAFPLPGDDGQDAELAFAIGASVRLDLTLSSSSGDTTYRIHPPLGTQFFEPRGGTVAADGLTATFVAPEGESRRVSVSLRSADAPSYETERASLGIVVDLRDVDVSIGQAMGGDFGTLLAEVTVRGELGVIAVPEAARAALGDRLDLQFVSSDAVRLLLDRGLLTREELDGLESALLREVATNLAQALGSEVEVTGGFDDATLTTTLVSDPPSGAVPIVFEARATFARPLSAPAEAAISLYSVPQTFTFPRVRGLDTTYTVVLPRGLAVTGLTSEGGDSERRAWSDGRDAFVVRPTGGAAETAVTMSVTPTFVLMKFWPLVLGVVVLLVLLVGTPVAVVRLRRKKA